MTRILHLPVKGVYFFQIKSGIKEFEYRLQTDYWTKRLVDRHYDEIHIKHGYPKSGDLNRIEIRPWRGFEEQVIEHEHFGVYPVSVFAIRVNYELDNTLIGGSTLSLHKYSRTQTSFYRRAYIAYLIDSGTNTVPRIMDSTGMPRRTAQDTISTLKEHGVNCVFVGGTKNGYYEIRDWGGINKAWVKNNMKHIQDVLECN